MHSLPDPLAPVVSSLILVLSAGVLPTVAAAQEARAAVAVRENFRAAPNGLLLGVLEEGTPLLLGERRGGWVEATVEGWMWTPSLRSRERTPYDLVVAADGGENLRGGPGGEVTGRMESGTVLEEMERRPGWIRVRRTGWIWMESVTTEPAVGAAGRPDAGAAAGEEPSPAAPPEAPPAEWRRAATGTPLLTEPDGDTLAVVREDGDLRILGREGRWARVRLEGWVWLPGAGAVVADDAVVRDVTPSEVSAAPEELEGRLVEWELQFISLERAEQVRTDFYEGEPFLLTRSGERAGSFVYVAVPPDQLSIVEGLTPLERIRVVGRVRTGSSALTGSPILDLMELARIGGGGG